MTGLAPDPMRLLYFPNGSTAIVTVRRGIAVGLVAIALREPCG